MDLQTYIDERNLTRYRLSQISGVPKTTITDICSGKSDIGRCSAHTRQSAGVYDGGTHGICSL